MVRNEGTVPAGGALTFILDGQHTLVSEVPAGTAEGDSVSWDFPVLGLGESFTARVLLQTPADVVLGTPFSYSAAVQASPVDAFPANNVAAATIVSTGPYDPNDMQVTPELLEEGDVVQGHAVTYMVRFQNTGTAPATNVRVTNLLPAQLQPSSFALLGSDHACHAELFPGALLEFRFDGIMLPDSGSDEPGSHGFVLFQLVPQGFLLPSAQVANSANIYFDANAPVATNSAVFSVESTTSIQVEHRDPLHVWPDPVQDVLHLDLRAMPGSAEVSILDAVGRCLRTERCAAAMTELSVANLMNGLYLIRVVTDMRRITQRFVKR